MKRGIKINIERYLTFLLIVILAFSTSIYSYNQNIHNILKDINSCVGNIEINLIRVWGNGTESDEKKIFYGPSDIALRKDGLLIYICDSGNNRVQVFDHLGKFITSIGQKGQGPGDFSNPKAIDLDNNNNLIVADYYNYRIQRFTSKGKFLKSFDIDTGNVGRLVTTEKDGIAVYNYKKTYDSSALIHVYDKNGNLVKTIGKHKDFGSRDSYYPLSIQPIDFVLDNDDNFYICYVNEPYVVKYSPEGHSLLTFTFEVPFRVPKYRFTPQGNDMRIIGEQISAGISVDDQGRIFLVTTTRPRKPDEKVSSSSSSGRGGGRTYTKRQGIPFDKTDLFRLLVFNKDGKIIATKKLDQYCNRILINGNSLYLVDTSNRMAIYEFEVSF